MLNRIGHVFLSAVLLASVAMGNAQAADKAINFGIMSTESSQNLKSIWQPFLDDMHKKTGLTINATFASDVVELTIICGFGGVDVLVPPGVNVRNETLALFGGTDLKRIEPGPGAPTIVLKGLVMFGGVDAKAPPQAWGDAE